MNKITSKKELDAELAKTPEVVAIFYSSWCPYCSRFIPVFDQKIPALNIKTVLHVVLDDDDNPLWDQYGISAVPTIIYFKDGKVQKRLDAKLGSGLNAAQLENWLGTFK
ncbi:MAG: thioredoxin family protein [Candidatus Bathyarchaeia archaeon]|jgi:thioredoxin 1